jgi:dolichol-phosphate mannosyltransferase
VRDTSLQETLSIVIPCYNEEAALPSLRERLPPVLDKLDGRYSDVRVFFVDDGSTDATPKLLTEWACVEPRLTVLLHEQNRGLGAALKTGFAASRSDVVVTTDADGTYEFAEILGLLALLLPDVDIVTASPYHPEGGVEGVPAYRLILSQGASLCYRVLLDPHVHTYTAMFRAYRRRVLDEVRFASPGYLSMAELLADAVLRGFSVAEFPVVLHVRKYGQSKAKVARILRDHLGFLWALQKRVRSQKRAGL